MLNSQKKSARGASLIETAVGLTFLIPIVLLVLDVGALVISQTSNDALAKHAAREAAGQSLAAQRQQAAQGVVSAFQKTSLADNPTLLAYSEPQAGQVCEVKTQVLCNLPVAVPFGGPSTQTLQSLAVEPITTTRATPTSTGPPLTGQANSGQADQGYLIMKSLTTGAEDPITEVGGAVVVPE